MPSTLGLMEFLCKRRTGIRTWRRRNATQVSERLLRGNRRERENMRDREKRKEEGEKERQNKRKNEMSLRSPRVLRRSRLCSIFVIFVSGKCCDLLI